MANNTGRFLGIFGLHLERQKLNQLIADDVIAKKRLKTEILTQEEYMHETNMGREEMHNGFLQSARARFQRLLTRIESGQALDLCSPGSFDHVSTLGELGRCLFDERNYSEAEPIFRRAVALTEVLIQHDPENRSVLLQQVSNLDNLGHVLLSQGQYAEGKQAYEQASQMNERIGDLRGQALSRMHLGTIALAQRDYPEARIRYQQTLQAFHALGELEVEADVWHQLGIVAQREENWPEAERGFRESLSIREQLGDRVGAAKTCNHLGLVAQFTHRFAEAKGWYQRAVQLLSQQADPTSAGCLCNLARCLIQEVQAGLVQDRSLQIEEARGYTEQAHAIYQVLRSPELWKTFSLLANIAEMQGRNEEAHVYRRQEKDAYASFAGNRSQIDQQFGELFPRLAKALDDLEVRAQMEEHLSQAETNGWHISGAIKRIWTGERDWQILVENLNNREALFVLRVLETLT
jgi:tetratricopeptide (TPR) repeat protein